MHSNYESHKLRGLETVLLLSPYKVLEKLGLLFCLTKDLRREASALKVSESPRCGYQTGADYDLAPEALFKPWHVCDRAALLEYVHWLSDETHEWLLAFYVDALLNLLSVETVAKGDVGGVAIDVGKILCRGRALRAEGFLLVHNHPSGDARPSKADIAVTVKLRRTSEEMDMPLLDHFIVAGGQMRSVGHW